MLIDDSGLLLDPIGPHVPNEISNLAEIAAHFAQAFSFSSKFFDFAVNLFDEGPEISCPLHPDSVSLGLGMYTQVLQAYRSVIANVQLGLSDMASAACRVIFERSAAFNYLFRKTVRPRCIEKGAVIDAPTLGNLSIDFRVQLYELHERYENQRWIEDIDRVGAGEDLASELRMEVADPNFVATHEKLVGPVWVKRLKQTRHYSGVGMKNVAATLGEEFWTYYLLRYRPLSWNTHAGIATWGVSVEPDYENKTATLAVDWHSDPRELWLPYLDATILSFMALKVFLRRFANTARNVRDLGALYYEYIDLDKLDALRRSRHDQ